MRERQKKYRAVIKFHVGPLVVNLETSSMYFLCKILNSIVFGLMDKLLRRWKIFATGLNIFARPNIIESKIYIELVSKLNTRGPILDCVTTLYYAIHVHIVTCIDRG